ncbi:MAG: hypothetical protein ACRDL7_13300, partial [Gaiellaceae bacterium]
MKEYKPSEEQEMTFEKVKNGTKLKVKIPIFSTGCTEQLLYMIHQFQRFCVVLEWDIVEDKYHQFGLLLDGRASETWDSIISTPLPGGQERDNENHFWNDVTSFQQGYIVHDALKTHVKYLRTVKKSKEWTVGD